MSVGTEHITSMEVLRRYIHTTLCDKEQLLEEQSLLVELPLFRAGLLCGMQFTLHGPRSVKLSAVWAADKNVVFLYDTRGERYAKVHLKTRFPIERPADATSAHSCDDENLNEAA
ncbi:MAG: hypothetical protein WEB58_03815 [Planctomycetaceae bacterium]